MKRKPTRTKASIDFQIHALHRYYVWTTLMKQDFEAALLKGDHLPEEGQDPRIWPAKYFASAVGTYMSYWYAGLYVVCEGWTSLGLKDPKVNALLKHSNLSLLRRYRNGAFHFQKDYFDARFQDFIGEQGTVAWVRELSSALGSWFLEHLRKNREDRPKNEDDSGTGSTTD